MKEEKREGRGREGKEREGNRREGEERERKYIDVNLIGPEVALLASVAMKQ